MKIETSEPEVKQQETEIEEIESESDEEVESIPYLHPHLLFAIRFAEAHDFSVHIFDQNRRVQNCNKGAEVLYGHSFAECIGESDEEVKLPESIPYLHPQHRYAIRFAEAKGFSVHIFDQYRRVQYCNKAAEVLYGHSFEECIGANGTKLLVDAKDYAMADEALERTAAGESCRGRFPVKNKQLEAFQVIATNDPFFDNDIYLGVICISKDALQYQGRLYTVIRPKPTFRQVLLALVYSTVAPTITLYDRRLQIPEDLDPPWEAIIRRCLERDANDRPSMEELVDLWASIKLQMAPHRIDRKQKHGLRAIILVILHHSGLVRGPAGRAQIKPERDPLVEPIEASITVARIITLYNRQLQIPEDLDPRWEAIIRWCLERAGHDRPSMEELVDLLASIKLEMSPRRIE